MSELGYCLAYRNSWTHPAFKDLREAAIWNFLYQNAFWKDGDRQFNGYTFQLKRGQIVVSMRFLAQGFGMTEKGARVVIQKLEKLGMVVIQGATKGTIITICNYDKFQSNEKTEGNQQGKPRANEGRSKGANKNEVNKQLSNEGISIYEKTGLSKIRKLTETRKKHLNARIKDCGGIDGWMEACEKIKNTRFLHGENDRGWTASFDWIINETNFTKIMEGNYDNADARTESSQPLTDEDKRRIEEARNWQREREAGN